MGARGGKLPATAKVAAKLRQKPLYEKTFKIMLMTCHDDLTFAPNLLILHAEFVQPKRSTYASNVSNSEGLSHSDPVKRPKSGGLSDTEKPVMFFAYQAQMIAIRDWETPLKLSLKNM